LVVIAIIAILAAILFPVFARAREKARQTTCTSNQRQIAATLQMYAQDHEETLPTTSTIWSNIGVEPAVLICPTRGKSATNGYVFDYYLGGSSIGAISNPSGIFLTADGAATGNVTKDATNEVSNIHSGKTIASYADGHVTASTALEVDPIQLLNSVTGLLTSQSLNYNDSVQNPGVGTQASVVDNKYDGSSGSWYEYNGSNPQHLPFRWVIDMKSARTVIKYTVYNYYRTDAGGCCPRGIRRADVFIGSARANATGGTPLQTALVIPVSVDGSGAGKVTTTYDSSYPTGQYFTLRLNAPIDYNPPTVGTATSYTGCTDQIFYSNNFGNEFGISEVQIYAFKPGMP
jgi:prepilin-type processing-associated H-X9-DG protein